MFRKTLKILSLIGLLLSVALWGVSYVGLYHQRISAPAGAAIASETRFFVTDGLFVVTQHRFANPSPVPVAHSKWRMRAKRLPQFVETGHKWLPTWKASGEAGRSPPLYDRGRFVTVTVPIYLLVILTGVYPAYLLTPLHRRRKRKKLGLCVACGYDLRGSVERCPECGKGFS